MTLNSRNNTFFVFYVHQCNILLASLIYFRNGVTRPQRPPGSALAVNTNFVATHSYVYLNQSYKALKWKNLKCEVSWFSLRQPYMYSHMC